MANAVIISNQRDITLMFLRCLVHWKYLGSLGIENVEFLKYSVPRYQDTSQWVIGTLAQG